MSTIVIGFFVWAGLSVVAVLLYAIFSLVKLTDEQAHDEQEDFWSVPLSPGYRGAHPHNDERVRETLARATRTRSH